MNANICLICQKKHKRVGDTVCEDCAMGLAGGKNETTEEEYNRRDLATDILVPRYGRASADEIKTMRSIASGLRRDSFHLDRQADLQEQYNRDRDTPVG